MLHPAEQLPPVPVEGFLADSDLLGKTGSSWSTIPGPLPAGGADLRLDQRLCHARDGVAATSCYVSAQAAHPSTPVVYGAAFRVKNRIDLQYWIWYPYNAYSPTVPPGDLWQVHEGDWEAVSVILDLRGSLSSSASLGTAQAHDVRGRRSSDAGTGRSSTSDSARMRTSSRRERTASILASSSRR